MAKTIRSYIKTRVRVCFAIGVAGWLLIPLGEAIARNLPEGMPTAAFPFVGLVVFGGAMFAMQRIVKCPKCKANLGRTIAMPLALSWGSGPKINFCPYCAVSLDQPLHPQQAQKPPASQNPIQ